MFREDVIVLVSLAVILSSYKEILVRDSITRQAYRD
jgi:hypothetical protein